MLPEEIKTAIKIIDERDRVFEDAPENPLYLDDTRFQAAVFR